MKAFIKVFSPYSDVSLQPIITPDSVYSAMKVVKQVLPSPDFISLRSRDVKLEATLIETIKKCLKNKQNPLGCVFVFSNKVTSPHKISWKLSAVNHRLKQRAQLFVVHIDPKQFAEHDHILKELGLTNLPAAAVYKNTQLNRSGNIKT